MRVAAPACASPTHCSATSSAAVLRRRRTPARPGGARCRVAASAAADAAGHGDVAVVELHAEAVNAAAFAPFGTLVEPGLDGAGFGPQDAQLELRQGTPRFYIMRLPSRGLRFSRITHHARVTQCLAAAGNAPWFLVVAPPGAAPPLRREQLVAFQVTPPAALALHVGTWHAGPFFGSGDAAADAANPNTAHRDFYNLELADTNVTDHTNFDFAAHAPRTAFRIVPKCS